MNHTEKNCNACGRFKKLFDIIKEDGVLAAFDYDLQLTRSRRPVFNKLCALTIHDLCKSHTTGYGLESCSKTHYSSYYSTTYNHLGLMVEFELK